MIKNKIIFISLVQDTKENADCLFTDNERLKEMLSGSSNYVVVDLNIPVGIEEFIKWKGGVMKILENMGACNVDIAINPNSPKAYILGADDKVVEASYIVSYNMFNSNDINYDYFRE